MNTLRVIYTSIVAAGCLALASCGGNVRNSYSEYHNVDPEGWRYDHPIVFTPIHPDSLCEGDLMLGLRHESTYPYSNLSLEVSYTDAGRMRRDTVEIALCDSYGTWTGKGIGLSFQLSDTVGHLTHASGTHVAVRHLMRCEELPGINQVGVFFVPSEKE